MKRALVSVFLLLTGAVLAADEPAAEPRLWPCVESVVIARIAKVGDLLDYNTEDTLVLHPPSYVELRVRHLLWGIQPPHSLTIVHQPELQHGDAMFLLGRRDGEWLNLGFEGRVARDRSGRFVVPFFDAPHEDSLAPRGWIPRDYFERLREIRYDPKSVPLLGEGRDARPGWARIEGTHSVANRGLILDDLEGLLAQKLGEPCKRNTR